MTSPTELLGTACRRAESLRDRYRAAGFWSAQPLDVVRAAAGTHPDLLAVKDRHTELSFAELDGRVDVAAAAMSEAGVTASAPVVLVVGNDVDSLVANYPSGCDHQ